MADLINPYDKAHELARAITGHEVYKRYVAAKAGVENNPEYQKMIVRIRSRQMEMNRAQILGQEADAAVISDISRLLAEANQIKEIEEFFSAESSFIQIFNDVLGIIQKAVEVGFK